MNVNNSAPLERNITGVREALFEQLERLRTNANDAEIKRAKAVSEIAGRIVDSARVEVEYVRATTSDGTGFMSKPEEKPELPNGMKVSKVHRLGG